MIQLLIYGVVIAVLAGGAYAVKSSIEDKGAAKMRATWAPLIEKCEASKRKAGECANEWTDAVAKNGTLKLALDASIADGARCSAGVKALADTKGELDKRKDDAIAKAMVAVVSAQQEAARQRAIAKQPSKMTGVTCEQRLQAVDASLDELAARQLRFNPDGPVGGGAENPAAGAGGGARGVHIRP